MVAIGGIRRICHRAWLACCERMLRPEVSAVQRAIETVDYDGFVELTEAHSPIISWKD